MRKLNFVTSEAPSNGRCYIFIYRNSSFPPLRVQAMTAATNEGCDVMVNSRLIEGEAVLCGRLSIVACRLYNLILVNAQPVMIFIMEWCPGEGLVGAHDQKRHMHGVGSTQLVN